MRPPDELPAEGDIASDGPWVDPCASAGRTSGTYYCGMGERIDERILPSSGAATTSGVRRAAPPASLAHRRPRGDSLPGDNHSLHRPPSFAESQFATIVRRQRKRRLLSPVDCAATGTGAGRSEFPPLSDRKAAPAPDDCARFGSLACAADTAGAEDGSPPCAVGRPWDVRPDPDVESAAERDGAVELKLGRSSAAVSGRAGWPFAGWGSMSLLELSEASWAGADRQLAARPQRVLGAWRAAAVAGNAVTGSIFYTLPAVVAAAGIWSPVSLLVACLLIAPFRWVMVELCEAFGPADSANYAFFTHTASMAIAAVAAAATALDALATGAVSASTAATYLAPCTPGMSQTLWVVLLLVALAAVCCLGLGDSSRVALGMLALHMLTMVILLVSAAVWWGEHGSEGLRSNWAARASLLTHNKSVARALFDGVCAAFVGLTGFECAPSYAGHVKRGAFPKALLMLQVAVLLVEPGLMLLCLAVLSPAQLSEAAQGGSANILALLGERVVAGHWLRVLVTVDAALVLAGGIITGTISFCGLLAALGSDRIMPSLVLWLLPRTRAPVVGIASFLVIALILEASTDFTLASLSQVFSLSFLVVLALFCIALFLARLRRAPLFHPATHSNASSGSSTSTSTSTSSSTSSSSSSSPSAEQGRPRRTTLPTIAAALGIATTAIGGNIALNPHALLLYALYALVLWALVDLARRRVVLLRLLLWAVRESRLDVGQWIPRACQDVRPAASPGGGVGRRLRTWLQSERAHPLVYFTSGDELSELMHVLAYVDGNDSVSRVVVVHCFGAVERVPSELEANYQLVDESFPTITVDLVLVQAPFAPRTVWAVAGHLAVPPSRCLIGCPHPRGGRESEVHWDMADLAPLRIIHA